MVTTGWPLSKSVLCSPAQDCVRGASNLQMRKDALLPDSDESNRWMVNIRCRCTSHGLKVMQAEGQ